MQRESVIFEKSSPGKKAIDINVESKGKHSIPCTFLRKASADMPQVSEVETVRHFTFLSKLNYGVDDGFYPLGSCTMKYNPKFNEKVANLDGFINAHPYIDDKYIQGPLSIMYELDKQLCEITGMAGFTLQPAAGAHGESTGLLIIKAYHEHNKNYHKNEIIIPDSAHGTNPASATVTGFKAVTVKSNEKGLVDINHLKQLVGKNTAGFMLTNPNTLGLFETQIEEILDIIHSNGGLTYYDGANANAIMEITRPGDMGFDVIHLNLHKTFATPHGGGGPGSGPVGVTKNLLSFLPVPTIQKKDRTYYRFYNVENTIGKVRSFFGNFQVLIKAYAYILMMGQAGLKEASEYAVLNSNYLKKKLGEYYEIPYKNSFSMHEFVISLEKNNKEYNFSALDLAKALIQKGFHPPTIYFPQIVHESCMIEPTETESIETLDFFISQMIDVLEESKNNIDKVKNYPTNTYIRRLNEIEAARNPIVKYIQKED